MCAVNAGEIHASGYQARDQGWVSSCFGWQGDHDAGIAIRGGGTEELLRMALEPARAAVVVNRGCLSSFRRRDLGESTEGFLDPFDARKDMGLTAAEGGKAEGSEAGLDASEVVTAQSEIMDEIASAGPATTRDARQPACDPRLGSEEFEVDGGEPGDQFAEPDGSGGGSGHGGLAVGRFAE